MKIIFLDMDGVLNSIQSHTFFHQIGDQNWFKDYLPDTEDFQDIRTYHSEICPIACSNMKKLLDNHPDIRFVISSTWRRLYPLDFFDALFKHIGMTTEDKVIGRTPYMSGYDRGDEIQSWLDDALGVHEIEQFVILDDDSDMAHFLGTDNFIQTDVKVGFDYNTMLRVDKFFGGDTI